MNWICEEFKPRTFQIFSFVLVRPSVLGLCKQRPHTVTQPVQQQQVGGQMSPFWQTQAEPSKVWRSDALSGLRASGLFCQSRCHDSGIGDSAICSEAAPGRESFGFCCEIRWKEWCGIWRKGERGSTVELGQNREVGAASICRVRVHCKVSSNAFACVKEKMVIIF